MIVGGRAKMFNLNADLAARRGTYKMETTEKTLADYGIDEMTLTVKEAMKIQYNAKRLAIPNPSTGRSTKNSNSRDKLVWLDVLLSKFIASKQNG